mgnify:CR=1 FL=1
MVSKSELMSLFNWVRFEVASYFSLGSERTGLGLSCCSVNTPTPVPLGSSVTEFLFFSRYLFRLFRPFWNCASAPERYF